MLTTFLVVTASTIYLFVLLRRQQRLLELKRNQDATLQELSNEFNRQKKLLVFVLAVFNSTYLLRIVYEQFGSMMVYQSLASLCIVAVKPIVLDVLPICLILILHHRTWRNGSYFERTKS